MDDRDVQIVEQIHEKRQYDLSKLVLLLKIIVRHNSVSFPEPFLVLVSDGELRVEGSAKKVVLLLLVMLTQV